MNINALGSIGSSIGSLKKLAVAAMVAVGLLSGTVAAQEVVGTWDCGAIPETVTCVLTDDGTFTVSGSGAMADYDDWWDFTWYDLRSSITSIIIEDGVTSIGVSAFEGCSGLTSVTIGNSVTSIGDFAFMNCTGLTDVTIGNSVTSIGVAVFDGCCNLQPVTIPSSVTSIGEAAFTGSGCTDRTWGVWGSGETIVRLKDGTLTVSGLGAMADYDDLWDFTWYDLRSSITSIIIEDGVTNIGESAFGGCSGLTDVIIGNSVTTIGDHAFGGCCNLLPVTIPSSVKTIGHEAFGVHGCTDRAWGVWQSGKTIVRLEDGTLTVSGSGAMADYYDSSPPWYYDFRSSIISIIIEDGVTSIGDRAFAECTALTSVTIGNSVARIGELAFSNCCNLQPVTIPSSVTSIGDWTFDGWSDGCTDRTWGVWGSGETIARFMDETLTVSGEGR